MKRYVLAEWPQSQEFLGHPDCFLIHTPDENAEQLDAACVVPEQLFLELKCMNKTVKDIEDSFSQYQYLEKMIRESMRKYLSKTLMDTSEQNPLQCTIVLQTSEGFGLSTLNYPWIYKMWQDPIEGIIYFSYDEESTEVVEFDEMLLEDLVIICKELDKN